MNSFPLFLPSRSLVSKRERERERDRERETERARVSVKVCKDCIHTQLHPTAGLDGFFFLSLAQSAKWSSKDRWVEAGRANVYGFMGQSLLETSGRREKLMVFWVNAH